MDFQILGGEPLERIIGELDFASISSLARTNRFFAARIPASALAPYHHPQGSVVQPVTERTSAMASVTFASPGSPSSNNADYDSLASTDTDMTSSPEEDEWEFEVTPEIMRRLSLLPHRSHGPTLTFLPTELQLGIFSYLDLIDSTCLGLTSRNLYVVHRAIHGTKIPLNTRRIGPNSLESAWEVVGKQECKQCGIYRCELHQHIKTWMPKELEYCAMKQNFGLPARGNASPSCYRGKPSKPKRCGRHPLRTTSVHQDDASFSLPQ